MDDTAIPTTQQLNDSTVHPAALQARLEARSLRSHAAKAATSFVVLVAVNAVLDGLYASSEFPVGYATGQTSFDGNRVKGWYAAMTASGTFDRYVLTQLFDFVFIACTALTGFLVGALLIRQANRAGRARGPLRSMGLAVRTLIPLGAALDATENLISLPMMAFRTDFPNALAVAHSSAAVLKFAAIGSGVVLAVVTAVVLGLFKLASTARRGGARPIR